MEALVDIVRQVVGGTGSQSTQSLANTLDAGGWTPDTTDPFHRTWLKGELRASVLTEGGDDIIQFVVRVVDPRWDSPDEMEDEYPAQIELFDEIKRSLRRGLESHGVRLVPYGRIKEDYIDFIESECWMIHRSYFSVGVAHTDEDLPILILAVLRCR